MRIALAALLAGIILTPCAVGAQPLANDAEIRSAFAGNTVSGEEKGQAYVEYFAPDGHIVGVNHEGRYKGNWQIFKNRMCVSYEEDNGKASAWDCSHVGLSGARLSWTQDGETSYSTIAAGNPRGL
ncbi:MULTISPECIES: hypothetical protein [Methylosinus]|uniref:Dihydrodipicolinate reductase n=1 Tax=Methylosinus trichosporium (strain ATCC 35070 / NCIMB 11131 / UNIQEM 75 / OB3b) TaxID=595536 RepID=A0A2D2CZ70_METT3|nr:MULTISPECIES: hypothetical protein [Methylosinus]ATQ68043.1 hypothetical protein CQW49_09185 [Methylosinus trichosporium OB3b]OBS53685.1 hypothetical protein A8B73_04025 [Methylosinus sp. 3S-1]